MSDNIKPFREINETPNNEVVELIEEALSMARSGRIRSVAIAASLTGHATYTAYETRNLQEAIGLVGFLHHTLCAKQRETPAE